MGVYDFEGFSDNSDLADSIADYSRVGGASGLLEIMSDGNIDFTGTTQSLYRVDAGSDVEWQVTFGSGGSGWYFPCVVRCSDQNNLIGVRHTPTGIWQLVKFDAGVQTTLDTYTAALSAGDVVRINRNTLDVYINDVLRLASTDTFNNSVTFVGHQSRTSTGTDVIEAAQTNSSGASISTFDDFTDDETDVNITGTSFGASQGDGFVQLDSADGTGGCPVTETSWGDTAIAFTAPARNISGSGANTFCPYGTVNVYVEEDGGNGDTTTVSHNAVSGEAYVTLTSLGTDEKQDIPPHAQGIAISDQIGYQVASNEDANVTLSVSDSGRITVTGASSLVTYTWPYWVVDVSDNSLSATKTITVLDGDIVLAQSGYVNRRSAMRFGHR